MFWESLANIMDQDPTQMLWNSAEHERGITIGHLTASISKHGAKGRSGREDRFEPIDAQHTIIAIYLGSMLDHKRSLSQKQSASLEVKLTA